jgi:hypothetical protein
MKYPTIAPSSIDFYHVNGGYGIPGWYPSLIVPTLRRGVVYRYTMNSTMDGFVSDSIPYFRTSNRYRDIAISNDGMRIYLITDSIGQTSGPSGNGTSALADRGAIIEYYYTGATLPLSDKPVTRETVAKNKVIIYPNPAKESLHVDLGETLNALPVNYRLMDMTGRILIRGNSREKKININTSALGRGMYLLTIVNANGLELKTEKIIIQ